MSVNEEELKPQQAPTPEQMKQVMDKLQPLMKSQQRHILTMLEEMNIEFHLGTINGVDCLIVQAHDLFAKDYARMSGVNLGDYRLDES